MNFTRSIISVSLCAALAATVARAQTKAPTTQPPPAAPTQAEQEAALAARAELEAKALALLEETAGEAAGLRLAENRVRLQASAADALWPHDEARAREIFQSALSGLASVTSALSAEDPRYERLSHPLHNLRREIAFAVAQRDPKLALEFVRGTRMPPPPFNFERGGYQPPDPELMLELQLAEQVAARDPREAIRLAEESLARGISGNLSSVLETVRRSDPQAASKLAADVVRKLRTANLSTSPEAAAVALYLLRASRPNDAAQQPPLNSNATLTRNAVVVMGSGGTPLALDEAARRELITALVNGALSGASEQQRGRGRGMPLLPMLQSLMPEVERLLPAQAAAVRRRLSEVEGVGRGGNSGGGNNGGGGRGALRQEYEQVMQTGTADAILQAASKAPAEMRARLYRGAAFKALEEGSAERARQIVNDSGVNPQQREQWLREIDQQLFWRVLEGGDVSQALALLSRVKSPEERAGMLLSLAQSAAARGNREMAERLLEEVWNQVGGRARNTSQFMTQLQVAQVYARFAPARSFEIVEGGVDHLNELLAAAAAVDGFGQDSFDQGEIKPDGGTWATLVVQSGDLLAALASKDFERARGAADRFQRPEARVQARLAVARGVLLGEEGALQGRGRVRRNSRVRPIAPSGRIRQD